MSRVGLKLYLIKFNQLTENMALIKCSECGKDISEKAPNCPACGNPNSSKAVLVEQTSKKWKIIKLVGWVATLVGIYIFIFNYNKGGFSNPFSGAGFCLAFVGIVAIIAGKFGAWWTNK